MEGGKLFARTVSLAAAAIGVHRSTLNGWRDRGCPGKSGRWWPVTDVIEWARENVWVSVDPVDDERISTESLELLRHEKYLREKIKREIEDGSAIPREEVHKVFDVLAITLRRFGEQFQREFGPEGISLHEEMLSEIERQICDAVKNQAKSKTDETNGSRAAANVP